MKRRTVISAIVSSFSILFAGCPRVDYPAVVTIDFDGRIEIVDSSFEMHGKLEISGGPPENDSYRDVHVNLYAEDTARIDRHSLGELRYGERLDVDISSDDIPQYVTFESPDFWGSETEVHYYEQGDDPEYSIRVITEKEELPVY